MHWLYEKLCSNVRKTDQRPQNRIHSGEQDVPSEGLTRFETAPANHLDIRQFTKQSQNGMKKCSSVFYQDL
ncbi:MAG: hypothetical protein ACXWC9_04925, partial [Pseudobdellovibrionaceae bacterium]